MTPPKFVDLCEGEQSIPDSADPSELLFRQICAYMWDDQKNQPTAQAFGPHASDERKPSFSRSTKVSAQASRNWHNANARSKSIGVWACSVAEVIEAETRAIDDSETPINNGELRAPGHAFVDYRHTATKPERKAIQAKLLMYALDRKEIQTVGGTDPGADAPDYAVDEPSD